MKAVLFAAGEGIRLQPLTNSIPKPLLKILGVSILERLIQNLLRCGVEEYILITNYKEELIREHINEQFPKIKVKFVHQKETKGTANALSLAKDFVKEEYFIASNGDCIYPPTLFEKITEAVKKHKVAAAGKYITNRENYGVILANQEDKIEQIIEKPSKDEIKEGYANVGIYSLNKKIFSIIEEIEKNKKTSSRGEYEITDAINELLKNEEQPSQLIKLLDNENWFDIGKPWNLLEANEKMLDLHEDERLGTIQKNVSLEGKVIIKKNAIIKNGTFIEGPVFIDEGAIIGPNCYIRKYSYIGKRVKIGNGCEVKNSIIGDDTHAAHLSYIGDSIIGPNCNFGAGTITANLRLDKKSIPVFIKAVKEDSNRKKLGTFMGQGVETGIGVLIMPGIKIGDNSWIGAGTIVNEDIPSESIFYGVQNYTLRRKRKDAD